MTKPASGTCVKITISVPADLLEETQRLFPTDGNRSRSIVAALRKANRAQKTHLQLITSQLRTNWRGVK